MSDDKNLLKLLRKGGHGKLIESLKAKVMKSQQSGGKSEANLKKLKTPKPADQIEQIEKE